MIYTVDPNSPPRYLVQGAAEDSSDNDASDFKKMRLMKTTSLAKEVFTNPGFYRFEIEVKFRNIFNNKEVRKQSVKASKIEVDSDYRSITCEFDVPSQSPIFFSYNHEARFSKATLFMTGPETDNQRKAMAVFQQYVDTSEDPNYTISSLNLQFRAELQVPSPMALGTLKPPVCKRLFFEPEASPVNYYSFNDQVKIGGIFQIRKMKVAIPTD